MMVEQEKCNHLGISKVPFEKYLIYMGIACLKGASLTITARCFIMEPWWCWSKSGPRSLKVCTKYTHTHTASAPTDMEGEWNASNGKYPLSLSNKMLKPSTISWMNSTMYCWNLYFSKAHWWNSSRDSTRLRISDFFFFQFIHPAPEGPVRWEG